MNAMQLINKCLLASGITAAALFAGTASAASISFTETAGGNVVVGHDAWDWQSFSYASTAHTATADADLFKFPSQGSNGDGTEVILLKNAAGQLNSLLTAAVTVTNASSYHVHYEFFSGSALPSIIPQSTGKYTDVLINGLTGYAGLQTFSQGIGVTAVAAAVPEAQSYALTLAGLGVVGAVIRRRRNQA